MPEKEQDSTLHRWKQHRHDSMGELNGVRCEVQTWRCEHCNEEIDLPGGKVPPEIECPAKSTAAKKNWVAPMKNKNDEAKADEKTSSNLRALIYSPKSNGYCELAPIGNVAGLDVNIKSKTWMHNVAGFNYGNKTPLAIGQADHSMKEQHRGVIGVYDVTSNKHLESMPNDWHEIQAAKHMNWVDSD